ncbi:MAG: tetratricopeptide repeat protein [Bacteroidota bacterium]
MKKWIILLLVLSGCSVFMPLQRSNLIGVFHLIETGDYTEAKEVVEEMIANDESSAQWARIWFARGLLAQTAYQEGVKKNDKKLSELYPDQLFLAYSSYEIARRLDQGGRLNRQLTPKYAMLSNDLKTLGEKEYRQGRYKEALRAFEASLAIINSSLLEAPKDYDLMYNAAIAAYKAQNTEKAIEYLQTLHNEGYSAHASHLLASLYLANEQTDEAQQILKEGIKKKENDQELVLLMADLLYEQGKIQESINILEKEEEQNPANYIFPYTRGLIYQKSGDYASAVEAYKMAAAIAPDSVLIYINLATSYHDLGVEIEEKTRLLTSNQQVLEKRRESQEAFDAALQWLDKAYEKRPDDYVSLLKIYQLYRAVGAHDKARNVQQQFK